MIIVFPVYSFYSLNKKPPRHQCNNIKNAQNAILDTRFSATNNSKPWRTVISYIQPFRLDVPTFKYMMFYFNISVGVDLHISIGHISTILCRYIKNAQNAIK
jgi:hypothetical protein